MKALISALWSLLRGLFTRNAPEPAPEPEPPPAAVPAPKPAPNPPPMTNAEKLYQAAKDSLGRHMTLNDEVPPELGCAQAMSAVAKKAGVPGIPALGFSGTIQFYDFMCDSDAFEEIEKPEEGAIIVAVTELPAHGHIGVMAKFGLMYADDWGIMSNDSNTGNYRELWNLTDWKHYYGAVLSLETHFFRWKG